MEENKETTPPPTLAPEVVGNGNGAAGVAGTENGNGHTGANGFVPLVTVVGFHHARFVCLPRERWKGKEEGDERGRRAHAEDVDANTNSEGQKSSPGLARNQALIPPSTTTGLSSPSWRSATAHTCKVPLPNTYLIAPSS
jgi:hypothetical protein